ncbi:MAG TPA: hypothetical protein VIL41_02915 [Coriobacteriia bacterium]
MAQSTRASTFSADADKHATAEAARTNAKLLASVVDALAGEDRRARQAAASVVHEIAIEEPVLLKEFAPQLADALHRPESQTRWEVLGTFEQLVPVDARLVDKALPGAETALHDEESGVVRLAAFRLLCAYGATTSHRSVRVWPFIDDGIRCYHGDPEFPAMLSGVYRMMIGNAADEVKIAAAERMAFDAENGKGLLKRRATRIVQCAPKKRGKKKA